MFKVNAMKLIIDASVEQKTIYEEDVFLHRGLCSFSSKSKKNILRHSAWCGHQWQGQEL